MKLVKQNSINVLIKKSPTSNAMIMKTGKGKPIIAKKINNWFSQVSENQIDKSVSRNDIN
jgi:hypothetical protein